MKAGDKKEVHRSKIDYVYKRCYVDKHGNLVDPRTPWDELLKYHRHGQRVLTNREDQHLESVDRKARREVRAEKIAKEKQSKINQMGSHDLGHMTNQRKQNKRKRIEQLATQHL
jgi:hypothetical protein